MTVPAMAETGTCRNIDSDRSSYRNDEVVVRLAYLVPPAVVVLTGPVLGLPDGWQLFINTSATVLAFSTLFRNEDRADRLADQGAGEVTRVKSGSQPAVSSSGRPAPR
jgi:hypothetical protein